MDEPRAIKGYEGLYTISKDGVIYSILRGVVINRINNPRSKLARVNLSCYGVMENKRVDALLAEAWLDNPHNYRYLHFKTCDRTNVSLDNLEYLPYPPISRGIPDCHLKEICKAYINNQVKVKDLCAKYGLRNTSISNALRKWASLNGLEEEYRATVVNNLQTIINGVRPLPVRKVARYDTEGNLLAKYPTIKAAGIANNINASGISQVLDKPNRKAGGFIWKSLSKVVYSR